MQIKYLTLAMTAALALNLTACGSDDDDKTKNTDDTPKKEMTAEEKAKAAKEAEAKAKADKEQAAKDEKAKKEAEAKAKAEKEAAANAAAAKTNVKNQVNDQKNNPGNTAYTGSATKQESTVGLNYRRGNASKFDRELNPTESGKVTVESYKSIQNKGLTNIVIGRETIEIKEEEVSIRRYAGQDGSEPRWSDAWSLQSWNAKKGVTGAATRNNFDPAQQSIEYSNVDITGQFRDSSDDKKVIADNGLTAISTTGQGSTYLIKGQEDQVLEISKTDKETVTRVAVPGQDTATRIFGHYYNGTEGLTSNGKLTASAANEANSWKHAINKQGYVYDANKGQYIGLRSVTAASATNRQIGQQSLGIVLDTATKTPLLAADAIKLNHVQYGRVTNNIDPVAGADELKGQSFIYAPYMEKFEYKVGDKITNPELNGTVDRYFYRGLGETTLKQMASLPKEAKYTYNGHAITYGLDNTFHGNTGLGDTNSFTYGTDKVGLGNFVTATYDVGAKSVKGYIYNVWLNNAKNSNKTSIDKLVNFEGEVVGNTVVNGKSDIAYTKTKEDGQFTGSFFGAAASELGGAVNNIKSGYGSAQWGGVFGAQRVTPVTSDNNADQID